MCRIQFQSDGKQLQKAPHVPEVAPWGLEGIRIGSDRFGQLGKKADGELKRYIPVFRTFRTDEPNIQGKLSFAIIK